ncbi:MAG: FitA-like ribbon-helix-helix domain-containing protein [Acidiferrobacter sp.]
MSNRPVAVTGVAAPVLAYRAGQERSVGIAYPKRCWHYASMSVQITIRDVPEKVRRELAARAATQGRSMQEFLRIELERLAAHPTADAWLEQVRRRKRTTQTKVASEHILNSRDADRP